MHESWLFRHILTASVASRGHCVSGHHSLFTEADVMSFWEGPDGKERYKKAKVKIRSEIVLDFTCILIKRKINAMQKYLEARLHLHLHLVIW